MNAKHSGSLGGHLSLDMVPAQEERLGVSIVSSILSSSSLAVNSSNVLFLYLV